MTSLDLDGRGRRGQAPSSEPEDALRSQPPAARLFVGAIIAAGALVLAFWGPRHVPNPILFATLLAASVLASSLRLRVPLGTSASNLSISYSVDFAALLLIGREMTMLVAGASAWLQSTFGHDRQAQSRLPHPLQHRRARAHGEAAGWAFEFMGGQPGVLDLSLRGIAKPLVASALAYYLVNTSIVATAVGLAARRSVWTVWQSNFLWTAPSYFVGAGAAVAGVVLWETRQWWLLPLAAAPVYLTFRSYRMYVDRIAAYRAAQGRSAAAARRHARRARGRAPIRTAV